ncbi:MULTISPECIES: hypothetical protein [unclassified Phaeobacter]
MQTWGTGFATYQHETKTIAYKLSSEGSHWSMQGYGYHANGALVCEYCSGSNRDASWGLVHFNDTWSHRAGTPGRSDFLPLNEETEESGENDQIDEAWIKNASARAQRRFERLYYPWITLQGADLTAIHLSDSAHIGDFKGYVVIFAISHPSSKGIPAAVDGLIAFELTDGCAYFSGTVALPLEAADQQLKQLLASVHIGRVQLR